MGAVFISRFGCHQVKNMEHAMLHCAAKPELEEHREKVEKHVKLCIAIQGTQSAKSLAAL
jgi:hypothetical protein